MEGNISSGSSSNAYYSPHVLSSSLLEFLGPCRKGEGSKAHRRERLQGLAQAPQCSSPAPEESQEQTRTVGREGRSRRRGWGQGGKGKKGGALRWNQGRREGGLEWRWGTMHTALARGFLTGSHGISGAACRARRARGLKGKKLRLGPRLRGEGFAEAPGETRDGGGEEAPPSSFSSRPRGTAPPAGRRPLTAASLIGAERATSPPGCRSLQRW